MKKVLLIGGAGFIGHHLALKLVEENYEVEIIDSFNVNNANWLFICRESLKWKLYFKFCEDRLNFLYNNNIKVHWLDARDYHAVSKVTRTFKPDIVIHLAAVAHANKSNKDPRSTFDHNLRTLENSLDASVNIAEQFIYFSSSMVYGNFKDEFVTEESKLEPIGMYGKLKLAGELMVTGYKQIKDLNYTIIRPSALYGERCVSGRIIQKFIENKIDEIPLIIHGDGSEKLDFTYIKDLVNGVYCTIGNGNAFNSEFNITYGESRRLIDAARLIDDNIIFEERDKLLPKRGTLSVDKAKRLLGYKPVWNLEDGVKEYMRWYYEQY